MYVTVLDITNEWSSYTYHPKYNSEYPVYLHYFICYVVLCIIKTIENNNNKVSLINEKRYCCLNINRMEEKGLSCGLFPPTPRIARQSVL